MIVQNWVTTYMRLYPEAPLEEHSSTTKDEENDVCTTEIESIRSHLSDPPAR